MISKKTLTTLTLAIAMSVTIVAPAFASTGDIYSLSGLTSTSKPTYTKAQVNVTPTIQKQLNVSGSSFGYEGNNGQIFKLSDVNTLYGLDGGSLTQTLADLSTKETVVATVGQTTGLAVSSVSAIDAKSVSVDFTALTAAQTGATVTVKDNNGNTVAVTPQNFEIGETGATFTFVTPLTAAPTGTWTVNGVSFDNDTVAELATINTDVAAGNQVTTLAALKAAGLTDITDANIADYIQSLNGTTGTVPTTLAEAQTDITAVNTADATATSSATVIKAVSSSTNQVTLLAAIQNSAFSRVNSDWITDYATKFAATPITTSSTIADVQANIDFVDKAKITAAPLTTVAEANAKVALEQAYLAPDVSGATLTPTADAIKATKLAGGVFAVKEAKTGASVYNALVALSALDSTDLPATSLNANLKTEYLAEVNYVAATAATGAIAPDYTSTATVASTIVTGANALGLNAATAGINALTATSTTTQIQAALQTLADNTSQLGTAKFDISTVQTASLLNYATSFIATPVTDVASVNAAITAVNANANQAVYLNTIKTSTSVTAVENALNEISLADKTSSTSASAYINDSSALKLEIAQFVLDNQANLATTVTAPTITVVNVAPASATYAANALQKASLDEAAKIASFNKIDALSAATITSTKTALDAYAYAPYVALTDSQKLAVAESINGLTKTVGTTVTKLDFTTSTGADAVTTQAQANAYIDAAIAATK